MSIITNDFLLKSKTARHLYEAYAKDLPIIDYHSHVDPREIAEDRRYENITQLWLGGDHYKWRLIRSNGIDENEITGTADAYTKFRRFAEALPKAIGNPMYHWTHMELKTYFGYDGTLNAQTADAVWELCNRKLKQDALSVRGIITSSNVELIGTTDDPTDDLSYHKMIASDASFAVKVLPTFRPDKAVHIEQSEFADYIAKLSAAAKMPIAAFADVTKALEDRLDYFCELGCKASDHSLTSVAYARADERELDAIVAKALAKQPLSQREIEAYQTELMLCLGSMYEKRGIVMQLHYGALRNVNSKAYSKLGADAGFDCFTNTPCGESLAKLLNALAETDSLPKTVLYCLNAQDNAMLDVFLGAFQSPECAGKIQHGAAWWFNDTKRGMEVHMQSLAELSLLGNFIGMLTDSRSFLSYTRHDYFRRIVCNTIGQWVEDGEYPHDEDALREIIEGICYRNAKLYFGL